MTVDALVFDAYGTLYDVHSVVRRCETCFPGKGTQLSQLWRAKQLEYTWQRSLMQRYVPFSQVTREALAYSCQALGVSLREHEEALMAEYLRLAPFPEVPAAVAVPYSMLLDETRPAYGFAPLLFVKLYKFVNPVPLVVTANKVPFPVSAPPPRNVVPNKVA